MNALSVEIKHTKKGTAMNPPVYRFAFPNLPSLLMAQMTLQLAMVAAEGLFGKTVVCMDVSYYVHAPRNVILIDATTAVGASLVRIYTALLIDELGEDAFTVRRVESANQTASNQEAV